MAQVLIDPVSRIDGHLSIDMDVVNGAVASARVRGDMFRGFEPIMKNRNPVDANMISQRICGVCPVSHAIASSKCLESAFGISPSRNGMFLRNIILATNFLQSHIIHFYHLSLMDYADFKAVMKYTGKDEKIKNLKAWAEKESSGSKTSVTTLSPFLPRYEGDFYIKKTDVNLGLISNYLKALDIRMKCQKLASIFAGKIPHAATILPGGVTQKLTPENLAAYKKLFQEIDKFVNETYYPDVISLAKAFPDYMKLGRFNSFLSFGVFGDEFLEAFLFEKGVLKDDNLSKVDFGKITEDVRYSKYNSASGLKPAAGRTVPEPYKKDAYTWSKAPRYEGAQFEVGPLARIVISYQEKNPQVIDFLTQLFKEIKSDMDGLKSAMGRHISRAIEAKILTANIPKWLDELQYDASTRTKYDIPKSAKGAGFVEAPGGALGHWITITDYRIDNYQIVAPDTWNLSPRDDRGTAGAMESALMGTPVSDVNNPIEPARIVRSFNPCVACAAH